METDSYQHAIISIPYCIVSESCLLDRPQYAQDGKLQEYYILDCTCFKNHQQDGACKHIYPRMDNHNIQIHHIYDSVDSITAELINGWQYE
jgi:hypothetical protein